MNQKISSLVGCDGEALGWLIGIIVIIVIVVYVLMAIALVILGIGALIGAFYSLTNYFASFKENVIDSNRKTPIIVEE